MKRTAIFIALGSIIAGIMLWFWPPAPCEGNTTVLPCLNGLTEALYGSLIIILGIILLPLIPMSNSLHYALALLGVLINFWFALVVVMWSVIGMNNSAIDIKPVDLFISTVMGIQGVGFFCAGLSGLFAANIINATEAPLDKET